MITHSFDIKSELNSFLRRISRAEGLLAILAVIAVLYWDASSSHSLLPALFILGAAFACMGWHLILFPAISVLLLSLSFCAKLYFEISAFPVDIALGALAALGGSMAYGAFRGMIKPQRLPLAKKMPTTAQYLTVTRVLAGAVSVSLCILLWLVQTGMYGSPFSFRRAAQDFRAYVQQDLGMPNGIFVLSPVSYNGGYYVANVTRQGPILRGTWREKTLLWEGNGQVVELDSQKGALEDAVNEENAMLQLEMMTYVEDTLELNGYGDSEVLAQTIFDPETHRFGQAYTPGMDLNATIYLTHPLAPLQGQAIFDEWADAQQVILDETGVQYARLYFRWYDEDDPSQWLERVVGE